jgi:ubiquinone/menaquinone biosynthesis C-methylase UbiE
MQGALLSKLRASRAARQLYVLAFRPLRASARDYDYLRWNAALDLLWKASPPAGKARLVRHMLSSSPHYLYPKNDLYFQPGEYEAAFERYNASRETIASSILRPHVRSGDVVLELGCGPGGFLRALSPHCREVIGVDVSRAVLRAAEWNNRAHRNVTCKVAGGLDLAPVGDAAIDFAFSIETVQHLDKIHALTFFHEFHRVLKPGASVLFNFTNFTDPEQRDMWLRSIWKPQSSRIYADLTVMRLRYYLPEELRLLLRSAGFATVSFRDGEGPCAEERATLALATKSA